MIASQATAPVAAGSGVVAVPVTAQITGLAPATTYWFRAVAHNDQGTVYGATLSLTTRAPPVAATGEVSGVGEAAATLAGEVTPRGLTTRWAFEVGTDPGLAGAAVTAGGSSGTAPGQAVRETAGGLLPGTVYYFRLRAENADGVAHGDIRTFTTASTPRGTTLDAVEVTDRSASLRAEVAGRGPGAVWCFFWAENPSMLRAAETDHVAVGPGMEGRGVAAGLGGLRPGTVYYYRVWVQNASGWTQGEVKSFTTRSPPEAHAQDATDVTVDRLTLRGLVHTRSRATRYRFEWGTTPGLERAVQTPMTAAGSAPTVAVSRRLEGLRPGTTYYYRLIAESDEGASASPVADVTTQELPEVTALPAVRQTRTGATIRGRLNSREAVAWWFEWGLFPSRLDRRTPEGAFPPSPKHRWVEFAVTGVPAGRTFYYRLVARTPQGTTASATRTEATLAPPTAITSPPVAVGRGSAAVGARLYARRQRTTWWFQYGTSRTFGRHTRPVTVSPRARSIDVRALLSGLAPGRTYHYRVVAQNRAGTTYGMRQTLTPR
jgi:phosphodiesterase/alkaline phosphatase D-like protein